MFHELLPPDYVKRITHCNWFTNNINNDAILNKTFFTDVACFDLNGYMKFQNIRLWTNEK